MDDVANREVPGEESPHVPHVFFDAGDVTDGDGRGAMRVCRGEAGVTEVFFFQVEMGAQFAVEFFLADLGGAEPAEEAVPEARHRVRPAA